MWQPIKDPESMRRRLQEAKVKGRGGLRNRGRENGGDGSEALGERGEGSFGCRLTGEMPEGGDGGGW